MREKWAGLTLLQRAVLIAQLGLFLLFTALYPAVANARGVRWRGSFLARTVREDAVVYTGRVKGADTAFALYPDGRVECRMGEKDFGPYTVTLDPTAVEEMGEDWNYAVTGGVEIREGDAVLFRGGYYLPTSDPGGRMLLGKDGPEVGVHLTIRQGRAAGDPEPPTAYDIFRLAVEPPIENRGDWTFYVLATALGALNVISVLYAEALFQFQLGFRIREPERAEPSDWELLGRNISWCLLLLLTLFLYGIGLSV